MIINRLRRYELKLNNGGVANRLVGYQSSNGQTDQTRQLVIYNHSATISKLVVFRIDQLGSGCLHKYIEL